MKKIREQVALRNELGAGSENRTFTFNDLWKYGDRRQMEGSYAAFENVVLWCDKKIKKLQKHESIGSLVRINELRRVRRVFKQKMNKVAP